MPMKCDLIKIQRLNDGSQYELEFDDDCAQQ